MTTTPARILVVEDEYLIRMLLEDMLADLGHTVAAAVGTIAEAEQLAATGDFDCAVLDVNLDGLEIFPVADILMKRGKPFVFVTGYGEGSLPEAYRDRPALQKPFQAERLEQTLNGLLATV
ncbi:MAG: response regulator [Pseudolabrys sp.]|nr:response regulator [Pseudolabrys sp.]MDP2296301.1 response regulator [Pseudolabrys sp.]